MNVTSTKQGLVMLLLGILIGILTGGVIWITASPPRGKPITLVPVPTDRSITIYISGEVKNPGVYDLPLDSRVQDAVNVSGGFLPDADTSAINLAALLVDSSQIDVKSKTINDENLGTKININTATALELESLPGIGPTAAKNIIDYRIEYGSFSYIEDIQKVAGIGPVTFAKIERLITVGK
jgi:competence protein ComEA